MKNVIDNANKTPQYQNVSGRTALVLATSKCTIERKGKNSSTEELHASKEKSCQEKKETLSQRIPQEFV